MAGRKPADNQSAAQRRHAASERERYRSLPVKRRQAIVQERDREAQQAAERRRQERDREQRNSEARGYQTADRQTGAHNTERKARATVRLAEANGTLKRPATCQKCGSHGRIEAHHPDHSKPSTVSYLCSDCHGQTEQGPRT